jgi:hypothetical protein
MLKVLFINNFNQPDYLSNMLYIGLANKQDVELYTYAAPFHLISGIGWNDKFIVNSKWEDNIKAPGFTVCSKIKRGPIIDFAQEIKFRIQNHFYDKIIYSSIWRDQMYFEDVIKTYSKKDIIMIDGDDHELILESVADKGIYFKRELFIDRTDIRPIAMAIPDSILQSDSSTNKTQLFSTVYPGRPETYIFKTEQSYYEDYQKSYFGTTFKKGGWDCLRHYEIIGNKCIPYFIGLEECPKNILFNWPKKLILKTNEYAKNSIAPQEYDELLEELYCFAKQYMTTSALANYVIETSE